MALNVLGKIIVADIFELVNDALLEAKIRSRCRLSWMIYALGSISLAIYSMCTLLRCHLNVG